MHKRKRNGKKNLIIDLIEIHQKIKDEYENFKNHDLFRTKEKLVKRFDKLYNLFKLNPTEGVKVERLMDEPDSTKIINYYSVKGSAATSCSRIRTAYRNYREINSADVEFNIKHKPYSLPWTKEVEGSKYLLEVFYKDINYNDFLEKYSKGIDLGYGISLRVHLSPFAFEVKPFVVEYLKNIILDHQHLHIEGFDILPFPRDAFELNEIYVPLRVKPPNTPSSSTSHFTDYKKRHHLHLGDAAPEKPFKLYLYDKHSQPIEHILQKSFFNNDFQGRHCVILGSPGSGKSTLLSYLALSLASGLSEGINLRGFIPLYINLLDYTKSDSADLIKFAISEARQNLVDTDLKRGIKSCIESHIEACAINRTESYGIVLLLDELDKTGDNKPRIIKEIERLKNRYKKAFIVVTSRIINYYDRPLNGFNHYMLDDLKPSDMNFLISSWFDALSKKHQNTDQPEDFYNWFNNRKNYLIKKIRDLPSLFSIAKSPYYLTYIILLAADPKLGPLPNNLNDLFYKFINWIIKTWKKNHNLQEYGSKHDFYFEGFKELCWKVHMAIFENKNHDLDIKRLAKSTNMLAHEQFYKMIDFLLKSSIFESVSDSHGKEFLMPTNFGLLEYGFGLKLADHWAKKESKNKVYTFLTKNIYDVYLHEPLKFFIRELQNPDEFINFLIDSNGEFDHSKLMLSAELAFEVKDKLKDNFLKKRLLKPLISILESSTPYSETNQFELWPSIGMLGRINYLKDIFISEIKKRRSLEDKLSKSELDESGRRTSIRAKIVDSIARSKDALAISCLKEILYMEVDAEVRYQIAEGLCTLGESDYIISYLLQLFKDESDKYNKIFDMNTIGTFGDYRVIPRLKNIYNSESDIYIKLSLIQSISRLRGKGTTKMLKDCFDSEEGNSDLQIRIANRAADMGKIKLACSFFQSLSKNESDPTLKKYSEHMVGRLSDY